MEWYVPSTPASLSDIRLAGVTDADKGVNQIPNGDVLDTRGHSIS